MDVDIKSKHYRGDHEEANSEAGPDKPFSSIAATGMLLAAGCATLATSSAAASNDDPNDPIVGQARRPRLRDELLQSRKRLSSAVPLTDATLTNSSARTLQQTDALGAASVPEDAISVQARRDDGHDKVHPRDVASTPYYTSKPKPTALPAVGDSLCSGKKHECVESRQAI